MPVVLLRTGRPMLALPSTVPAVGVPKNEVERRGTRATYAVGCTSPGGRAAQAHTRYGPGHTAADGVQGTTPVASSRERCGGGERLRLPAALVSCFAAGFDRGRFVH